MRGVPGRGGETKLSITSSRSNSHTENLFFLPAYSYFLIGMKISPPRPPYLPISGAVRSLSLSRMHFFKGILELTIDFRLLANRDYVHFSQSHNIRLSSNSC